jgi:hypothetical protein
VRVFRRSCRCAAAGERAVYVLDLHNRVYGHRGSLGIPHGVLKTGAERVESSPPLFKFKWQGEISSLSTYAPRMPSISASASHAAGRPKPSACSERSVREKAVDMAFLAPVGGLGGIALRGFGAETDRPGRFSFGYRWRA